MKHSVLPFICCVALCLVAVEGLSNPAKQKLIKACTDRGATPAICTDGVRELENGLAINDITGYLNTLGFQVHGHAGPALSLFWTGFAVREVHSITLYLSLWEPKFFTSTNILPAAMMNDAGGPYSLGLTGDQQHLFWAQFSAWMAASTVGNFAFWFTGGTTDAFFPSPCVNYPTRCFFEEYELPNLQQVTTLVVLHLPQQRATASKSKCSNDRVSYNKLRTLNANLQYFCCDLPAVDQYQGPILGVFNHISGIATALENDPTTPPGSCIDLQQHFQPGKYSFARAFRGFLGRLRSMFTGRKKRDALGDIVCNHINTTLRRHAENGKLSLSNTGTQTIAFRTACLESLYLLAFTSGKTYSGSNGRHKVEVSAAGQTRSIKLPDLPGDNYLTNKGDLWKLSFRDDFGFTDCVTLESLDATVLVADSTDGWNIDSIVSYVCAADHCQEVTHDFDVSQWIDTNGEPEHERFILTDVQFHSTTCLESLYLLAFTSGRTNSGSNGRHKVEVSAAGQTRSIKLPDLPGDDYLTNKGDLWKLSFRDDFGFTDCVMLENLDVIKIVANSTDGWNIDSIASYVCAADHCQEVTHDFDVSRWIDANGKPEHKRFILTDAQRYNTICIPGICGTTCVYVWGTCVPTPAYSACCSRVTVPSVTFIQNTLSGTLIGSVPSSKTLNISELFPATFEVGTPFNKIPIEDLHYNCSSTKLYIKTRALDTLTIIPGILELSSVTIELNATLSPVGIQRFVFSANWVIGSVNGNFAIDDNLEKGQLLLRGGPQGSVDLNFENMIESLSGKRISLPVTFRSVSFRDIEVVGEIDTFSSGSATFSISGRYGQNNEAHVILQKGVSNSGAKYAAAFAAEFTTFRFNDLIHDLTSVDISGFPFLGSLVVPTMAVTVSTASISSASLLEVFETSSLLRLSNVHIQGGVTTFFNVSNVPLKMSYFNREFSFEVLQGGSISLSVLLSKVGLSPDSVTQLRVPGINEILNLNIIHFSMNTSSREIQIALRFPNTLSYFNDLLKIQNVVVRVHALLNTQQQSVSGEVSGHVEIGGQFLEVVIKKDSTNNYMLSSKALQLNLSDIIDRFNAVLFPGELNGVITASGLFDFSIRDMCIELTVGTQSSQLEISGSPAIQGFQAPELSALIVIEGSTYLIVGLKFGTANLANLIHSVSGFDLHSIAILNQQLEVAILVSPLSPTALQREKLSGLRITKGVSLEATITMSSTCSDVFCTAAKRLLGTNTQLMLRGTIMDTQSLYLFAGVSNISLGSKFTLAKAGFEVSKTSDALKFGISGTLQISEPKINLTGAIRVGTKGIELELSTSDCWEKPFGAEWLTVCSLRGVVDLKPELDFLPVSLEIGGQVKIGKPSCGSQLSASGFIGLDADMPQQNYYYVHIKDSLTFESLLDRFCKDVDLPNALSESGFPEGFLSSFSLMGKELPHVPLSIPRGFQMKGKIDILGLTATTDININYPSSFKVVVLLPPLDLANGKLTMRASRNDDTRGPFLNASIHLDVLPPSVNIEASGYVNVLDISHQAMLHITNEEYKFYMSGKMLNLFQASLNISASYGSIRTAAFQVHGRFTAHLCFKVEEAIESTINKTANGTTEARAAAERSAKTTKTEYEDTETERDNAQSEVGVCQAKFDTALSLLEDAREALRSICTPRNCDDVSWWAWPTCQLERLVCIGLREAPGLLVSQLEQKLETARSALNLATSAYNSLLSAFEAARTLYNNAKSELDEIIELERRAVEKIALHTLEEIINLKEITFDASLGVAATGSFSGSVSTCIEGKDVNLNIHVNLYDVISIARQIADYIIPGLSELF